MSESEMRPVQMHTRTRIVERTELLSDGENWQARCSCGWATPLHRRRQTAQRKFDSHVAAPGQTP